MGENKQSQPGASPARETRAPAKKRTPKKTTNRVCPFLFYQPFGRAIVLLCFFQGESWTNFQLLPEEYRVAAEANARAALSQAREQVGGTAPDAALDATVDDENDSFIGGANANDLTRNDGPNEFNVGYDINADGFDAVRFMR